MQRLFSMFPNGWPGRGLLVLRVAASSLLLTQGVVKLMSGVSPQAIPPTTVGMAAGLLILIGLWTPVGCLLAVVAESWLLFIACIAMQSAFLLISISVAVATLGPGSWSIDAILFGRRRLNLNE